MSLMRISILLGARSRISLIKKGIISFLNKLFVSNIKNPTDNDDTDTTDSDGRYEENFAKPQH